MLLSSYQRPIDTIIGKTVITMRALVNLHSEYLLIWLGRRLPERVVDFIIEHMILPHKDAQSFIEDVYEDSKIVILSESLQDSPALQRFLRIHNVSWDEMLFRDPRESFEAYITGFVATNQNRIHAVIDCDSKWIDTLDRSTMTNIMFVCTKDSGFS